MTIQNMEKRKHLLCRLEEERKKLNSAILEDVSSPECLACSRRVDELLERLLELSAQ